MLSDSRAAQRKWPEEKLPVGLDSIRNFNVRAKVVGPSVSNRDPQSKLCIAETRVAGCIREIHSAGDANEGAD